MGDVRRVVYDWSRDLWVYENDKTPATLADTMASLQARNAEYRDREAASKFEVGQWVTLETGSGSKLRAQVSKVDEDEHHGITTYTLHQFPEVSGSPTVRYWDADWNELTEAPPK